MSKHLRPPAAETGASAVEYALLIVAIALIMVFGAFFFGKVVKASLTGSGGCVNTVDSTATSC